MGIQAFVGEIRLFGGAYEPEGWAFCSGQLLPVSGYTQLFALLGTRYGGDGNKTFGLPNLQSRVPIGMGQGAGLSNYTIPQIGGNESVTLSLNTMPTHTHTVASNQTASTSNTPVNNFFAVGQSVGGAPVDMVYALTADSTMNPGVVGDTGMSDPLSLIQPVLALNYIICLQGTWPINS